MWTRPNTFSAQIPLGALAFFVALLGIFLVGDDSTRHAGVFFVLVGAVLAGSLWGRGDECRLRDNATHLATPQREVVRGAGISIGTIVAADLWASGHRAETFGPAGVLWLLAIALVLLYAGNLGRSEEAAKEAANVRTRAASRLSFRPSRSQTWELVGVVVLFAVALGLRTWNLQGIPYAIHSDEIITGRVALAAYGGDPKVSVFTTVWDGINLPALWFAGIAISLHLGGHTLAALRLPAALFGAATVIPFYGLVREGWGREAAIGGTVVLAVSASQVHFSRVTLNNIVTPFFWATCFYFLIRGVRRGRPLDWTLAGIAAGISEYGYYGTHLLPFVLLVFVFYLGAVHGERSMRACSNYGMLALGYVIGFGPLLAYFVLNPQLYFGRGQGVLTWNHIPTSWADLQQMWMTLWPLMSENLLGFSAHADAGTLYWAPLLLPAEAALLVLGTAIFLWRWRQPPAFLMLLAGFSTLLVGGTLVHGVPFFEHWTPAFPAIYGAIAAPIGMWARSALRVRSSRLRLGLLGVLAFAVGLIAWQSVDFYFNQYAVTRPEFEIRAAQSRWEAGLGPRYEVFTVGKTWQPYDAETNSYLVQGQQGSALTDPTRQLPLSIERRRGVAFVFFPDNARYEPLVRRLYPGGVLGEVHSRRGVHFFYTYVIPPRS